MLRKEILKRRVNQRLEEHKCKGSVKTQNLAQTIARLHQMAEDRKVPEEPKVSESIPANNKDFIRHATVVQTDRRRNKWALRPVSAAPVQRRSVGKPINEAASGRKAILIHNPPLPARTKRSTKLLKEVNPGRIEYVQLSVQVQDVVEPVAKIEAMEVDPPGQLSVKEVTVFSPSKPILNLLPRSGLVIGVIPTQRFREARTYEPTPLIDPPRVNPPIIPPSIIINSDPIPPTLCSKKRKRKPHSNRQKRHIRVREDGVLIQSYLRRDGTLVEYEKGPSKRQTTEAVHPKETLVPKTS